MGKTCLAGSVSKAIVGKFDLVRYIVCIIKNRVFMSIISIQFPSTNKFYILILAASSSPVSNNDAMRKPTRLEAMPTLDVHVRKNSRKRSNGPLLNTMGTF